MNRRLRKKKRIGEFQELGFRLVGGLRPGLTGDEIVALLSRLVDVVETRHLSFGGGAGANQQLEGFVTRHERRSPTEDDRAALAAFLASEATLVHHEVGALQDGNAGEA